MKKWVLLALAACNNGTGTTADMPREDLAPTSPSASAAPSGPAANPTATVPPPPACTPNLCDVLFDLPAAGEATAELRGDFAPGAWDHGVPMTKNGSRWQATLTLPIGKRVEYKLCADPAGANCGAWRSDPSKPTAPPYGNNVVASVSCASPHCPATPPPPDDGGTAATRFVLVGDTGKGSPSAITVGQAISTYCVQMGCDFVALLGDNIYDDGAGSPTDPAFQDKFEIPYAGVSAPVYALLGNHDYGGNGAGDEYARAQNEIDYTAHSTKWRMPSRYYHFVSGPIELFALDTNAQMRAWDPQQNADVSGWIAASTAPWKLALGHHPYKSNGPHGNAGTYDNGSTDPVFGGARVKQFADSVWCGKVDVAVMAHDHTRQWLTDTCQGTELAISGAGSAPSSLPGTQPTRYQSAELGFLYVVATAKTLAFTFVDADGTAAFNRVLTH